ncbi:unnamed protein product [Caenorhabditis sp. 36 PRJEB53466]|nr:unnamed protein product [Caenorhabditis sp. 36 PRJEB53466]
MKPLRAVLTGYEAKLRIQHVKRRFVIKNKQVQADPMFKVPRLPEGRTFHWHCENTETGNKYRVKFTPRGGKKNIIPARMYNQKRFFKPRYDSELALTEALFEPSKPPKPEFFVNQDQNHAELSEAQLRGMAEYRWFFENWDEDYYSVEDCYDIMHQAVKERVSVYEDVYKRTHNTLFLARAVFIKYLDLNRLSKIHKIYLILTQEVGFPMFYVESILRRYYE